MQPNSLTSKVLDTKTVDESAGVLDMSSFDHIVTFVTGTGTISGGELTIEEAAETNYTGTWAIIGTAVDLTDVDGGATLAVHLPVAAYRAVRWRINDTVAGGGSVTVTVGAH